MKEFDVYIPSRLTEVDVWISNLGKQMGLSFNTDMIIRFDNTADVASKIYAAADDKMIIRTDRLGLQKDIFDGLDEKLYLTFACHTTEDMDVGGESSMIISTVPMPLYNGKLIDLEDIDMQISVSSVDTTKQSAIGGENKMIIRTDAVDDLDVIKYLYLTALTYFNTSIASTANKTASLNEINMIISTEISETVKRLRVLGDITTTDSLSTYENMTLDEFYYISD